MGLFGRFGRSKSDGHKDEQDASEYNDAIGSNGDKDSAGTDAGSEGQHAAGMPQKDDKTTKNGEQMHPAADGPGNNAGTVSGSSAHGDDDDNNNTTKTSGTRASGLQTGAGSNPAMRSGHGTSEGSASSGANYSDIKQTGQKKTTFGRDKSYTDAGSTVAGAMDAEKQQQNADEEKQNADTGTDFKQKEQLELDDILQRIKNVKDEYGASVKRLMDTKRDLNEKKLELETAEKKLVKIQKSIDDAAEIDTQTTTRIDAQKAELEKIKQETSAARESYDELLEKISQEQHALSILRTQQSETEQQLEATNARLYNAREELDRQDTFQSPDSLTRGEREFIEGGGDDTDASGPVSSQRQQQQQSSSGPTQGGTGADDMAEPKSYAGVVEAASVVVASLKSKLNMTQKELEAAQHMLDQERALHEETRRRLESALSQQRDTSTSADNYNDNP